jgi:hypothetical protein
MKYIISIALFINFSLCYSQDYKFDLLTKYNANQEGRETEKIVYSNSDNPNYFLFVKTDGKNLAYLSDLKNRVVHQLHFNEHKKNGEIYFSFHFIKSEKIKPIPLTSNYRFKFETVKEDSLFKTVKMTGYKNKKMTKVAGVSELKIKKHTKNLFPLYRYSYMHLFEYRTDINLGENGIIESSKHIGERIFECQLVYYKEIDLIIKI